MNINEYMTDLGQKARAASRQMSVATRGQKDAALIAIANQLLNSSAELQAANSIDLTAGREKGLDAALLDRLELTEAGITATATFCHRCDSCFR